MISRVTRVGVVRMSQPKLWVVWPEILDHCQLVTTVDYYAVRYTTTSDFLHRNATFSGAAALRGQEHWSPCPCHVAARIYPCYWVLVSR